MFDVRVHSCFCRLSCPRRRPPTAAAVPAEQPDSVGGGEENGGCQDGRGDPTGQPRALGGHHHRQRRCQVKKVETGKPAAVQLAIVRF